MPTPASARRPARLPLAFAIAAALALPGLSAPGLAAAQSAASEEEEAADLEGLIVTGTRVSGRTIAESLSPIDVITPEALDAQGSAELNVALSRLVPSFNFPRATITDGTDHVRPAQLRGLAPDQVLVLVNGKRRHASAIVNLNGAVGRGSSAVDLNAIPASAIERIEVLRDGASALYGSDAIAGVINLVLKGAGEGSSLEASWGTHDEGDGDTAGASAFTSLAFGEGFVALSAELRDREATNRAGLDPRQQYPLVGGQPDPREASANRLNHRFGDAVLEDRLVFLNAGLPLGAGVEAYVFGGVGRRDGEAAGFFRRPLDARNVPAVYPDGYLPLITSDALDRSVFAGARGDTAGGWAWDASVGYGGNTFDYGVANSINTSLGATSPRSFYAGTLENGQATANVDLSRGVDVAWLTYPLNVALGAELREETYRISAGQAESWVGTGSQVFPGFRPSDEVDASRDSWALYVDLEAELAERLTASAALRHEDYSDFGDALSGKLSARFVASDAFALRGTVSTGFRAPSLAQQSYSATATGFINSVPFDVRTFPVADPVARALGAEPLRAEESTSLGLGASWTIGEAWTITADAYRIDIDDRVVLSENLVGQPVRDFLAANGFPGIDGGRYFTNAVDTRTDGLDLISRTDLDLGDAGTLGITVGWNHNETSIERVAPNPAALEAVSLGLQRIGRAESGRITVGSPEDKLILGLDWARDALSARLGATLYGEYTVLSNTSPANDQTFGREWVFDASAAWQASAHWRLSVGVENLTDAYPDRVIAANNNSGIFPYPVGNAPFGFNGRYGYAKVRYTF